MRIFKKRRFFRRFSKKAEPYFNLPSNIDNLPEFKHFFLLLGPSNISYDNKNVVHISIEGSKRFLYNLIINPSLTMNLFNDFASIIPPSNILFSVDETEERFTYISSIPFLSTVNKQLPKWNKLSLLNPYASLKKSVKSALLFLNKEGLIDDTYQYVEIITFNLTYLLKQLAELEKDSKLTLG